jgi:hypothetical protein
MIERLLRRHYRSCDFMFTCMGTFVALVAFAYILPPRHTLFYGAAVWYFGIGLVGLAALTCIELMARCARVILHVRAGTFRPIYWDAPAPPLWTPPLAFAGGIVVGMVILAATPLLALVFAGALLIRVLRYALATAVHAVAALHAAAMPLAWHNSTTDETDLYQAVEQAVVYLRHVAHILPPAMREEHTVAMVDSLYDLAQTDGSTTPGDVHLAARRLALEAVDVSIRAHWGLSARFASPARTLRLLVVTLVGTLVAAITALNTIASAVTIATAHLPRYTLDLCIIAVILTAIIGGVVAPWRRAAPEQETGQLTIERG